MANCTPPNISKITNSQKFLTTDELLAGSLSELALEIGTAVIFGEGLFIPAAPFIWLALSLPDIIAAFSGRPKDQDTNSVIWAYNMSAYWPLHSLAANLQMALRNGAPISDSNPKIQAQFSAWKRGTIQSIQQLAGFPAGESSPGFWQLQQLINTSWAYSKNGNEAVLNVVRAIDCFTEVLSELAKQPPAPPPPPPPQPPPQTFPGGKIPQQPPPGIPLPTPRSQGPCVSGDDNADEILDFCQATQNSLGQILAAIQALNTGGGSNDACCTAVVAGIGNLVAELTQIGVILSAPEPPGTPIDLSGIVLALQQLATAIGAFPPALQACCAAVNSSLGKIASAIAAAPTTDLTPVVEQLKLLVREGDVKQSILDYLTQQGYMTGADAQTLQGAPWADAIVMLFRTAVWNGWSWVWKQINAFKSTTGFSFAAVEDGIAGAIAAVVGTALSAGAAPLYPEIKGIIDAVVATLQPVGLPAIGDVKVDPDLLLSKTLAPVLILNAVMLVAGYLGWEISEQLKEYVDVAAELVGLQEIRELKVGQMMRWGPMREAELRAKGTYRQEIAGLGTMASWVARGLYDLDRYRGLAPVTGTPPEQVDPTLRASYSGLGARRILPLIQTGLFTPTDIQDELTFSGLRPASMKRYLLAAPYLATNTERNALRSTVEKVYIAGLYSDSDLQAQADSLEQNTDRDSLILQRVRLEKLIAGAKDLEAEYTTMYTGGLIDDPTYRSYLAGIGLQPDMVNFIAGKAEARANAALRRKELADAARLARQTASVERQTALKNYEEGIVPLAVYVATLVETGLTPTQAAAWGDLAVLKKSGNVRWVYGLQLQPAAATVLKQRATALTDQRKRQLITQQQYVDALTQLGLSATWINALDATAEASLTPKSAAFPVPVET